MTHQVFLRVWRDHLESMEEGEGIAVLCTSWKGSSAGFAERQRHLASIRQGAEGYGVLCTPMAVKNSGSRSIKEFDACRLLKLGGLIEKGTRTYAMVVERVSVEQLARRRTSQASLLPELASILRKRGNATDREALATARIGQGQFRDRVLQMWNGRCCVTSTSTLAAVRASHIKPWRDASNDERLDPCNGLPLVANLDALFDAGLIAFEDDGAMLVAKRLNSNERQRLGLDGLRLRTAPNERTAMFLAYHRQTIFVDA